MSDDYGASAAAKPTAEQMKHYRLLGARIRAPKSRYRVLLGGTLGGAIALCLTQGNPTEPKWLWLAVLFAVLFGINLAWRNTR